MYWIIAIIVLLTLSAVSLKLYRHYTSDADVSRTKLKEWMDREMGVCILDVRSTKEYKSGHIPDSINIGHKELTARLDELKPYKKHKIVVYCERGVRARIARNTLKKAGFSEVYHLIGDMAGWIKAGWPTDPEENE